MLVLVDLALWYLSATLGGRFIASATMASLCNRYWSQPHRRRHLLALQEALSAREAQSSGVAAERAALRRDLEKLLRERGTLESLRQVVASAMKSQQVGRSLHCHAKPSGASLFVAVRRTLGVCL